MAAAIMLLDCGYSTSIRLSFDSHVRLQVVWWYRSTDLEQVASFYASNMGFGCFKRLLRRWLQLRYHSSAIRPRCHHSTKYVTTVSLPVCGLLHCDPNKQIIVTAAIGLRHYELNDLLISSRMAVERPSNRSRI